jgi:hypothetical protein
MKLPEGIPAALREWQLKNLDVLFATVTALPFFHREGIHETATSG